MSKANEKAYETLRQRLVAGAYAPGAQLKEELLAHDLGLSRTPIRAALKRLVDDGLATSEPGRGVRVSSWTDSDTEEIYHLRSLLEAYGAQRAAERTNEALVARLESLNKAMKDTLAAGGTGMRPRLQQINSQFHRAILEGSCAPRLRNLLDGIIDTPIFVKTFFISTPADIEQSLHHHMDITTAIAAGDGSLARDAMQLHLRIAIERFSRQRAAFAQKSQAFQESELPKLSFG